MFTDGAKTSMTRKENETACDLLIARSVIRLNWVYIFLSTDSSFMSSAYS